MKPMNQQPPHLTFLTFLTHLTIWSQLCRAVLLAFLLTAVGAQAASDALWSLGTLDGSSIEFAPGARGQLTFTVGQSVVSRDFAGRQDGSVGFDGKTAEKPYTIVFDLSEPPQGDYELALDLIYPSGAPRQIKVRVEQSVGPLPGAARAEEDGGRQRG